MSDNLKRFKTIRESLNKQYLEPPKGNQARHLNTLAAVVSGFIGSKSTNLPKIAESVADNTKAESRAKKYTRFLQNDVIDAETYFLPYVLELIASVAAFDVSIRTVERVRQRLVEEGLEAALNRAKQKRFRSRRLDGEQEAYLIALTCGEPPEGHTRWTLRLLADRMVELEYIEDVSHETIRKVLKKAN